MTDQWFERVPKVELHLHLEGSIPHAALWPLIQKYGGDPSVPDVEALERRFAYRDFMHFIETWRWKNGFLREPEDFSFIAEAAARDLARQNIRYIEAHYSPPDFREQGLRTQELTEAIRRGLSRVPEIEIMLIADLVRNDGPEKAARTLAEVEEVRSLGVIGVGLGGMEREYPPELFEKVFRKARRSGFRTTAHAGEAAGAESVRGAVRALKADRIGHGTRSGENPRLLRELAEKKIPLEMCPSSNVRTGVVKSIEEHPVRDYFARGLVVTVNTDDPKMFGNSLAGEFRLLEEKLGFSRDEIRILILNGIRSSWLPEERKKRLAASFEQDPDWR